MTRKHFEAIAATMREHMAAARINDERNHSFQHPEVLRVWLVCLDLAGNFADVNTRFDRERFLEACKDPSFYGKVAS